MKKTGLAFTEKHSKPNLTSFLYPRVPINSARPVFLHEVTPNISRTRSYQRARITTRKVYHRKLIFQEKEANPGTRNHCPLSTKSGTNRTKIERRLNPGQIEIQETI